MLTHSYPTRRSSDLPIGTRVDKDYHARAEQSADGSRQGDNKDIQQYVSNRIEERSADFKMPKSSSGKRSEEHTSKLQSLMRISHAGFCLQKNIQDIPHRRNHHHDIQSANI